MPLKLMYILRFVVPVATSTAIVELLKYIVKDPIMHLIVVNSQTIITWVISQIVDKMLNIKHLKKSSHQIGNFFSNFLIIFISNFILPLIHFKDIYSLILWSITIGYKKIRWPLCLFRYSLGTANLQ